MYCRKMGFWKKAFWLCMDVSGDGGLLFFSTITPKTPEAFSSWISDDPQLWIVFLQYMKINYTRKRIEKWIYLIDNSINDCIMLTTRIYDTIKKYIYIYVDMNIIFQINKIYIKYYHMYIFYFLISFMYKFNHFNKI